MDDFDQLNASNPEIETSIDQKENDLLGSDFTANPVETTPNNGFDNDSTTQQPNLSWLTDDLPSNATSTAPQRNLFYYDLPENTLPTPQTTSFATDSSNSRLDTQDFQSYSAPNFTSAANNEYSYNYSDQPASPPPPPEENNSSFNMYTNSGSSSSLADANPYVAKDNLSALNEFNARRQQEIADMEVVEKQKIEELRQQAKKDLERWYEERRAEMEQKRRTMREEQDDSLTQALQKSDKQSCDWAKVIRLLDFSQGTQITKQKRDINRMRAVIVQAKRDRDDTKSENGV